MLDILMGIILLCASQYSIDSLYINTDEFAVISEYAEFNDDAYARIGDDIKTYAYEVYTENESFMLESNDIIKEMGMKFCAELRVEDISFTDNYISVLLFFFSYTGGAHGIHDYICKTYDRENGAIVKLSDIISMNQLKKIASHCRNAVGEQKKSMYEDYEGIKMDIELKNGTKPDWDNFENFIVYEDSLIVIFNEYEIAPYYMGAFRVNVPDSIYTLH